MSKDIFIIAEAGINHNGEIDLAKKMIDSAKEAGVDCIKFQTFKADEFITDPNLTYTYKSQGKEVVESMLEMFKRYEFSKDEWQGIINYCKDSILLLIFRSFYLAIIFSKKKSFSCNAMHLFIFSIIKFNL